MFSTPPGGQVVYNVAMAAVAEKAHWYRLTPDRCVVAILAVEGFLWLSPISSSDEAIMSWPTTSAMPHAWRNQAINFAARSLRSKPLKNKGTKPITMPPIPTMLVILSKVGILYAAMNTMKSAANRGQST